MIGRFTVHSHPKHLVNISSGLLVNSEISKSLLNAVHTIQINVERLRQDSSQSVKVLYQPISKSGLKHLMTIIQTNVRVTGNSQKLSVSPELIYQRALTLAKVRTEINLAIVLSNPVTATFFKKDGINFLHFLHVLEDIVNKSEPQLADTDSDVSL